MKIAFTGTHCSGKTTAVYGLGARLKRQLAQANVGVVDEPARYSPYPINREVTENGQIWIGMNQIVEEMRRADRNEVVICDRTVVDNLAYVLEAGLDEAYLAMAPLAWYWVRTYDAIVYMPPLPLVEDGVRADEVYFQERINHRLRGLYKDLGIEFSPLGDCEIWMQNTDEMRDFQAVLQGLN